MKRHLGLISALVVLVPLAACQRREHPERRQPDQPAMRGNRPMAQPPTEFPPELQPGLHPAAEQRIDREAKIDSFKTAAGIGLDGSAKLEDKGKGVHIVLDVKHAPPGRKGVHIHEKGDCSNVAGKSMGAHFAPEGHEHDLPVAPPTERHLGDLGNMDIGSDGKGRLEITVGRANLVPGDKLSYLGKALVIHEAEDMGKAQQPAGGSGKPIACGVIERD